MRLRFVFFVVLLIVGVSSRAQVRVISPLPKGILQVRDAHALLHFRAFVPVGVEHFCVALSSDTATVDPYTIRREIKPISGWVDTVIKVPKSLRNYTLWWFADSSSQALQGSIPGLTPGHIIGIAGQSNAVGFNYGMFERSDGDIRMLHSDSLWEMAHEPTGNQAGGPWIVMANELYRELRDSLPVGIVNVAVGATGLVIYDMWGGQWIRNPLNPEDSSVYGNAIRRLRKTGGNLEALCWIQGESDCNSPIEATQYQKAFLRLMSGFHEDLNDTFPIFHLQISGRSYPGVLVLGYPAVREAQRILPPSSLVGTAVGRPMEDDGIHFSVPTIRAVGRMFADALLVERYGQTGTHMYPPLLPADSAAIDSISVHGQMRRCLSLNFHRSCDMASLQLLTSKHYFAIYKDGALFDTSKVEYRLSQSDSTSVLIYLLEDSIVSGHEWSVTYVAEAGADEGPLAIIDPISNDTIYASAFDRLPVKKSVQQVNIAPPLGENVQGIRIDPDDWTIICNEPQRVRMAISNDRGVELERAEDWLNGRSTIIPIEKPKTSGLYWLQVSADTWPAQVVKILIIR